MIMIIDRYVYLYIYRSRSMIIYHGDFYFHVWVPRDDQEKMDYVVRAAEDTALPWRAWECHFNRRRWVVYHGLYQGLSSFPWISMAVVYSTSHLQTHPNHLKLVVNGCDSIRTPFISPLLLFKLSMFFADQPTIQAWRFQFFSELAAVFSWRKMTGFGVLPSCALNIAMEIGPAICWI